MRPTESGQAIVELILTAGLLTSLTLGSALLIRSEWDRVRCAGLVFEFTHAARIQARPSRWREPRELSIRFLPGEIHGSARCGSTMEEVRLPRWAGDP